MPLRIPVSPACATPCPSCDACDPRREAPTLDEVRAAVKAESEIILGGGDASAWSELAVLLESDASVKRVWVEAPARALSSEVLGRLAGQGVHGVFVQIEATGRLLAPLRCGDGEVAIAEAEALGLRARARICVRPSTLRIVVPLARRLAPRSATLEITRNDWQREPVPIDPRVIEQAFAAAPNLSFEHHRLRDRGYLPPCALPALFRARPMIWRTLLEPNETANCAMAACSDCDLRRRCGFADADALAPEVRALVRPVREGMRPRANGPRRLPVPEEIAALRTGPEIPCIAPWTTMEIVDPVGLVNHCCTDWTIGARGNARVRTLDELWNGPNYRAARRSMLGEGPSPLCRSICPRLHDRRFAERSLQILERSPRFVENQLRLAEDLALRREEVRAKPLYMTLCPTTYCNYSCVMCNYGRLPRRDLPDSVLEQVDALLPTLRGLTLLGGEPLASPAVMRLLHKFDRDTYPDGGVDLVTNGSLLTERTLDALGGCAFGAVVVSLNAATSETYANVHGGASIATVLANVDALLRFRERNGPFGVTLSFVVQPMSAQDLVPFGEIAASRGLDIRLLPLNPQTRDLDFYGQPESVARVLAELDRFADWAREVRPRWLDEVSATRRAVAREAGRRQPSGAGLGPRDDPEHGPAVSAGEHAPQSCGHVGTARSNVEG